MDETRDYVQVIIRGILNLEVNSIKTRRALYEEAFRAQLGFFDNHQPPFEIELIEYETKLLRALVRFVESEIRSGVDISVIGYAPQEYRAFEKVLQLRRANQIRRRQLAETRAAQESNNDGARPQEVLTEQEYIRLCRLQSGLRAIAESTDKAPQRSRLLRDPINAARALLIYNLQVISAESRIALVWTLITPAVLLTLISSFYFFLQVDYVLNMDVPTFAVLGGTTWIMCRQVIFRTSTVVAHGRTLISIPQISILDTALSIGLVYLIVYSVVFCVLLSGGYAVGITTPPDSIPRFVAGVLGVWVFAFAVGLVFGSIAVHWRFFLRFATSIERSIQLFSSVFFVSEQLPEDWKPYVLWCPTAHGIQLVRAGYFAGYSAPDASVIYFVCSVACMLMLALLMIETSKSKIQPL